MSDIHKIAVGLLFGSICTGAMTIAAVLAI